MSDLPDLHPGPHRAVLACACGQVLDSRDMVRIPPPVVGGQGANPAIWRIGCVDCARKAVHVEPVRDGWTRTSNGRFAAVRGWNG